MSNVKHPHHNATLSYQLRGTSTARLRCKQLSISYGINAEESHAKNTRAFYPHLRVQGTFALTFDFVHWPEYTEAMTWFRRYINALMTSRTPSPMVVTLNARKFVRLGVPTTGISFGDHVGSMVFSPTITFISVADPRDSRSSTLSAKSASHATLPAGNQTSTNWFYPDSKLNHPGALQQYVYDQAQLKAAQQAADLQDLLNPPPATGEGTSGSGGPDRRL